METLFTNMTLKAMKEAPPDIKAKALKAKKAVLECIHSHKKKICMSPIFWWPRGHCGSGGAQIPPKEQLQEKQGRPLCHHQVLLEHWISLKKREDNTLAFTVVVKASKHRMQQSVKRLSDIDVVKANTQIRPDER
ncbi:Hypothetical predicted protein, partial [Marmota monax]